MDRLNALDRRVLPAERDPTKLYDSPPPWWLKYGYFLGGLIFPLVVISGPPSEHPLRVVSVVLVVIGGWVAVAVAWVLRHRVRG